MVNNWIGVMAGSQSLHLLFQQQFVNKTKSDLDLYEISFPKLKVCRNLITSGAYK